MDRVDSSESHLDLDIDLESGGSSDEDASGSQNLSPGNSKNVLDRIRSGSISSDSLHEPSNIGDCSYPYDKFRISDEISAKNEEKLEKFKEMINCAHMTMDKEKPKKHNSAKPPRPPKGPSLYASDMKLLKDISELNLKRKRMERIRALKKTKKEKVSSLSSNLIACLVTIIFFMVIIFQGLLGSRM